jgi:nucleotide-binding universal stress UspA family protein
MKILLALDANPYSAIAVNEVRALAANTWANVTFLGLHPQARPGHPTDGPGDDPSLLTALNGYVACFMGGFPGDDCPYRESGDFRTTGTDGGPGHARASNNGKKHLVKRLRYGDPVKAVLAEVQEDPSDLIVMGCDPPPAKGAWPGNPSAPQRIVNEAPCSVMVVKQETRIDRIVCCLDQDTVTQASLELINQLLTIHGAGLTLVGFSGSSGELKADVESRMANVLRYYRSLNIEPLVESVDRASLESFISQDRSGEMMALWIGPQTMLGKWLPKKKMNKLVTGSQSTVLILR